MAYIEPNSTVHLLKGVPLEPTYENSVWYRTPEAQLADFMRYNAYTLSNNTYVHKSKGVIRVEMTMAQVYDCNYLLFKNINFENKWFYAFITRVEYISNDVTEIHFVIDVLQTWLFQIVLEKSFIEREITGSDHNQDWLIPESVDVGQYFTYEDAHWLDDSTDLVYVVCAPFTINEDQPNDWTARNYAGVSMVGGIPSGMHYTIFNLMSTLNKALAALTGTIAVYDADGNSLGSKANLVSEIVSIVLAPAALFTATTDTYHPIWDTYMPYHYNSVPYYAASENYVQSYPIRNKKLTAYPYQYVLVTDHNGNDKIYRPELFSYNDTASVMLQLFGDTTPNGGVLAFPKYYNSFDSDGHDTGLPSYDILEGCKMGGLPTISWTPDVWKAWLSSTGVEGAMQMAKSAIESLVESYNQASEYSQNSSLSTSRYAQDTYGATGNTGSKLQKGLNGVVNSVDNFLTYLTKDGVDAAIDRGLKIGGAASVLIGVVQNMSTYYQQSLKPNTVVGSQSGGAKLGANLINLSAYLIGLGIEAANRLDDFFDAYGYQVNKFDIPWLFRITNYDNMARMYRYYVKTAGANIHGSIPKDDIDLIEAVFDSGIRFWYGDNGDHPDALMNINDYTLDNTSRW